MKWGVCAMFTLSWLAGCSSDEADQKITIEPRNDFIIEIDEESHFAVPSPLTVYFSSAREPEVQWGLSATETNPLEFGVQLRSLDFLEDRALEWDDIVTQAFISVGGRRVSEGALTMNYEPGPVGSNATIKLTATTQGTSPAIALAGLVTISCVVPEAEMPGSESSPESVETGQEVRVRDTEFVSQRCSDLKAMIQ